MRRVLKWAGITLAVLILLPVLLVTAVLIGVNTGPGQRLLASTAERFVPGLTLEGLHGPIPGGPGFAKLTMADADGPWLEVEDARLGFDFMALLNRDLRIEELSARRVALLRLPPGGEAPPEEQPPTDPDASVVPGLPDLPVEVHLDRLAVQRLEIGQQIITLPSGGADGLALSLDGSASLVAAALQAKLGVQRLDAPGQFNLDLGLDPHSRLAASLTAQEPPGGLLATSLGIPDAPAQLALTLDGPADGADLTLRGDFGGQAGIRADGRVALTADGASALALKGHLDAPAALAPEPVRAIDFDVDAAVPAGGQPQIRRLNLDAKAGTVRASGSLERLQVDARIAGSAALAPLVPDTVGWEALELSATAFDAERFEAVLRPRGLTGPDPLGGVLGSEPVVTFRGTASHIDELLVEGAGATLRASGDVGDRLGLLVDLTVPDLKAVRPEVTGPLTAQARVSGPMADPAIALTVQSPGLTAAGRRIEALDLAAEVPSINGMAGTLRLTGRAENQPISVNLRAAREGDLIRLAEAQAVFGPVTANADGVVNTATLRFDGQAVVDADNLAPLAPLVGQPIAGALHIEAKGHTGPDGRQVIDASARTRRIEYAGQPYALDASVTGTDADANWRVDATLPQAKVAGRGRLTQGDAGMRLDIAAFSADAPGNLGVRLAAPAAILMPPSGAIEIPGLRIAARPAGNFTISGVWGPERADIRVALAALPASLVNMFAPEPKLAGTVVGEARITGPTTAPEVNATVNGTGLRVDAPWSRGWPAATLRVEASRAGSGAVRANAALRMGNVVTLDAEASLPQGPGAAAPVQARLSGSTNLQPLLTPSLGGSANTVAGRIVLDGGASGTLAQPVLNGTATLSGGEVRNPLYGLRLRNIRGQLRAAGEQILFENIVAQAGNGRISVNGNAQPFAAGIPMQLDITARDATPVQSELVTALLDADLRFTGPLQTSPALNGTVQLKRVAVNIPRSLPGGGVATLGDVRERGADAPEPAQAGPAAPPIALNVNIQAPQSILVRGRGLDTELGGSLRIGGTAADPQPEGAFTLRRGTFQLIDRRIEFDRSSSLAFDGEMMPTLDFTATTRAQNLAITINIDGPPNDPKISFTSVPELPQDEVLARLLFNRPLDQLSPFEIAQLASGAAALAGAGPGGSRGLLGGLADRLGLDRLGVGGGSGNTSGSNTEETGPSVQAGGYIGQGVYVGVEQGTEGGPRVGVELELTPRLKLESSTGGESGERIGLSYEFEY
ncbi:translocation/assembly module TamB domain-containing protein [Teichococcus vastitatis]|uniref:Translocation/assembly module TamB domain-containing protein n=1 Tax=Teichococcus vastitatis TaxID=2307076 RepID=A0ABS9W1M4_9PROT|nr:translocation/assembly module TamB domain-containing protein [Pseudoroseomonas vastitatis]MCI0752830.1 translocation/assembly module TamB domain-containing protein [Pseudoroseomonas vastitatis]